MLPSAKYKATSHASYKSHLAGWHGNAKKLFMGCLTFVAGLILGVYLNKYGYISERISVDLRVNGFLYDGLVTNSSKLNKRSEPVANASSELLVPNIVHYIWFGKNKKMNFIHYISIRSAHQIQKPDVIMFHFDNLPSGKWWDRISKEVPLRMMHRFAPRTIHGQKLMHIFHQGDVAKLEVLQEYGGIYLDLDVVVLQRLDVLRVYPITLGKEKEPKLIAGIIIAHRDALFLQIWYESYRNNYRPFDWDFNCARLTYQLYRKRPDLVHMEPRRLTTPDWTERHLLFNEVIDWSDLYVIHIMAHLMWDSDYGPENIKRINSTFGEIMRFIYYGSPLLR